MLLALLMGAAAFAQFPLSGQNTISVTGDAEIKVVPDRVILFLGAESRDKSLDAARGVNDRAVRSVLEAARRDGIDPADTQTDFVHVSIAYNRDDGTQIDYFIVRKSIVVTLRVVDRFEQVLADLIQAGANHVHGVDFQTAKLRQHRDEARALAVKAASEKARDMAAAAGLEVGAATSISSWNYGAHSWYGSGWWGPRGGQMAQNVVQQNAGGAAPEGTIALGRISVTAQVTMSFRLE